jgi:hypothetical protein
MNDSAAEKIVDAIARAITASMSLPYPGVAYENVKSEIMDVTIPAKTPPRTALARLPVENCKCRETPLTTDTLTANATSWLSKESIVHPPFTSYYLSR